MFAAGSKQDDDVGRIVEVENKRSFNLSSDLVRFVDDNRCLEGQNWKEVKNVSGFVDLKLIAETFVAGVFL